MVCQYVHWPNMNIDRVLTILKFAMYLCMFYSPMVMKLIEQNYKQLESCSEARNITSNKKSSNLDYIKRKYEALMSPMFKEALNNI